MAVPCIVSDAFAAHPLVTDDTGTQGRGNFQLEATVEYGHDNDNGDMTNTTEAATTLTYGLADAWDIVLGIPYQFIKRKDENGKSRVDGIADVSMEIKWRFYEQDGVSFALKPGMNFPTGNYKKGLGSGKLAYDLFFIATIETKPWAFYFNLGYSRNENRVDERQNLWFVSTASALEVAQGLNLAVNIGAERNTDREVNTHPAFILGGLIYSLWEDCDIDIGVKKGLTDPETDYTITSGVTWRF
ncbi:MAG TPA: transporter [Terriglobales bacterium]|nr:transporter [Terriglobales bacterium]